MWLGALLTSTAANFGRLILVGLLPNAVLVGYVWLLLAAGAFTNRGSALTWSHLTQVVRFKADAGGVLLFVLLVMLLTAVLQPFQIQLVRLVEGYWKGLSGEWLYRLGSAIHSRRRQRLNRLTRTDRPPLDDELAQRELREQIRAQRRSTRDWVIGRRAAERLRSYPPGDVAVMPTMLGNVLKRYENIAGERYALNTLYTWRRLYPLLNERVAADFRANLDSVDASTNLSITFTLMSGLGFVAFANDRWLLIIPITLMVLTIATYRAAIASAHTQGIAMLVAYDLHRFDLLRALHVELPATAALEAPRNRALSRFLRDSDRDIDPRLASERLRVITYKHPSE